MDKKKFLKYIAILVVTIVVLLIGISLGINYKTVSKIENKQFGEVQTASLMIDYANGKLDIFKDITVASESTVFDILKRLSDEKKLQLTYKDYGGSMGAFVESIGGIGKDINGEKWWQFYVNNEYSTIGASNFKIEAGDIIEFKFIKGQR